MTGTLLRVLCVVLIVVWASGIWVARHRRGHLTEENLRRAEEWHERGRLRPPDEDPLLVSLDLALRDGCESGAAEQREECLPSGGDKG
jgi:hypothetical protein